MFGGHDSRLAFFGPIFALTVVLLIARSVMSQRLDRGFAAGSAFMMIMYIAAEQLSRTDAWHRMASTLIKG